MNHRGVFLEFRDSFGDGNEGSYRLEVPHGVSQTIGRGLVCLSHGSRSIDDTRVSRQQLEVAVSSNDTVTCVARCDGLLFPFAFFFLFFPLLRVAERKHQQRRGINPSCVHRNGECLVLGRDQSFNLQFGDVVSLLADHSSVAFRIVEGTATCDPAAITPATFVMESFSAESVVDHPSVSR